MDDQYVIPGQTRIGHVHLKVADLNRSLEFYRDLLGFELTMMYGSQAAFISAGGLACLNTRELLKKWST